MLRHPTLPPAVSGDRREFMLGSMRLSYYVAGPAPGDTLASARPLLLIHSINAAGSAYEIKPLYDHYRRERAVYALDLPGCGESDPAPGVAAVEAGINAVGDFLQSMRIRIADVLAFSDGCAIARRLAAAYPGQIRRVALLAEAPGPTGQLAQPSLVLDAAHAAAADRNARLIEFLC